MGLAFSGYWCQRNWQAVVFIAVFGLSSVVFGQVANPGTLMETPGLKIDAVIGWDSTVSQSAPVPISFLIENQSTEPIEGELRLHDPATGNEAVLGEVFAGPVSTRRFSSILDMRDWERCIATVRRGREILWRRELILITGNGFFDETNYVLFVDESGRRLALSDGSSSGGPRTTVYPGLQSVNSIAAKSWQMPTHPGPLVVLHAIVLPDEMDVASLNDGQWRAIADWVCLGGTVFVHRKSSEILAHLFRLAPLNAGLAAEGDPFRVSRLGLGSIVTYTPALFSNEGKEVQKSIGEHVARLPRLSLSNTNPAIEYDYRRTDGSAQNGLMMTSFFGGYTLLSGLVVLLMFRRSRRQIAMYTVSIVLIASVCAGILGGVVRMSRGDLNWTTLTMAGEGGIVQVGRIELKSAGGRDNRVAVRGEHPDLQFTGTPEDYYGYHYRYSYSGRQPRTYHPFTRQSNPVAGEDQARQINVPITPWGRRQARVIDFGRGVQGMDVQLAYISAGDRREQASNGEFTLKVVNHSPFDLQQFTLWITAAPNRSEDGESKANVGYDPGGGEPGFFFGQHPGFFFGQHTFQNLISGATQDERFNAYMNLSTIHGVNIAHFAAVSAEPNPGSDPPPPGTVRAWITGRLNRSPLLEIDEEATEFVNRSSTHFFVQEIRSEDISIAEDVIADLTEFAKTSTNERLNATEAF